MAPVSLCRSSSCGSPSAWFQQQSDADIATPTEVIGYLFDTVANANMDCPPSAENDPRVDFECIVAPDQPVSVYMTRFYRFRSTDDLWVMALIMVHRLQSAHAMPIFPRTVHRLLAVGLGVAVKVAYEAAKVNALVAGFGGVDLDDLNEMELTFLELLDWDINVWREEYDIIVKNLTLIEEYACRMEAQRTLQAGRAQLLPAVLAQQLTSARAKIRNTPSVVKTAPALCPLGFDMASPPLIPAGAYSDDDNEEDYAEGIPWFTGLGPGHWPSTPPLPGHTQPSGTAVNGNADKKKKKKRGRRDTFGTQSQGSYRVPLSPLLDDTWSVATA
eukprot:TRINITY_DN24281_c4_g1_i1.p1 TRINITY_DN24281_c4_g1~~TRINITY_DN24281_c4_g1_i1.p1  ORF type:complete len:330 (+),score=91.08 TRINITY_DN24281_c4_g1_i1:91-1080(+)